jgi:Uma2 family endonuclease
MSTALRSLPDSTTDRGVARLRLRNGRLPRGFTKARATTITLAEFLKLPETKPALEFINGRIIQKVPPKFRHSVLQTEIVTQINRRTMGRKVGLAAVELRCTFAGRSIVPDVSYFRWDRIQFDEHGEPIDDVFLPPDFAVEVLSPDQSEPATVAKLRFAVAHEMKLGWLVNPSTRTVKVFRPGKPVRVCRGTAVLNAGRLVGGFRCTVDELFGWLKIA